MNTNYPAEIFPLQVREALDEYCRCHHIDKSLAYSTFLSLIGTIFSQSSTDIQGFETHPNLYMLIVANSGVGKSHLWEMFVKTMEHYENTTLVQAMTGDELITLQVNNFTVEALTDSIVDNQKRGIFNGVLIYQDEFTSMLGSMGKYSGKSTTCEKDYLKSGFNGVIETQTRVGGSRRIRGKCYLSLLSSIQPDMMKNYMKNKFDGFQDRFLFAFNNVNKDYTSIPFGNDYSELKSSISKMNKYIIGLMERGINRTFQWECDEVFDVIWRTTMMEWQELVGESKAEKVKQIWYKLSIIMAIIHNKEFIDVDCFCKARQLMEYYVKGVLKMQDITEDDDGIVRDEIINIIKKSEKNNTCSVIMNRSRKLQGFFKNDKKKLDAMLLGMVSKGILQNDGNKYYVKENV
jgi:hypothetical protein